MGEKKNKKNTPKVKSAKVQTKKANPLDKLKEEIAQELGLMGKVKAEGWAGLTAAESGRIGGIMTKRLKAEGKIPTAKTSAK